jgi:hypothetical protein
MPTFSVKKDVQLILHREIIAARRLHVQRMEENRIPIKALHMNLEATRPRGRPRNRWQGEVREDGRIVGGEGWKERLYNREE